MKRRGAPKWRKNIGHHLKREFYDGERMVVAVKVKNTHTKETHWQIDGVRVSCDGDGAHLYHDNDFDEPYDSWSWQDIDYYIPLGG